LCGVDHDPARGATGFDGHCDALGLFVSRGGVSEAQFGALETGCNVGSY